MTFKLGLTGSIGMGKSATAQLFVEEGCALWDADAAVHRLYGTGGGAVEAIAKAFPEAIREGQVSRQALKQIFADDPTALTVIESIVHPLVAQDRLECLESSTSDITVLDIPLLFETGSDSQMDAVVCVSIPEDIQQKRVMARGTMTEEQFLQIKSNQMPNSEKEAKSDYVIITDTVEHARLQVQNVLKDIRGRLEHA